MSTRPKLLVTCEHGGNRVPPKYRPLFKRQQHLLHSHRAFDAGALAVARQVAAAFGAELVFSTTTRLLVELNRSPNHPKVFSELTRPLPRAEREHLLARYYHPYREWVEAQVREAVDRGERLVHLSCHSFTAVLDGVERRADVGLLYDPRRPAERELCAAWQRLIKAAAPELVVRRNYPYQGYSDGLTTHLRRRYPDPHYCGIELEVNQKHAFGEPARWAALRGALVTTLAQALHRS